ncbi:hypothetical protein J2R98_000122 [Alkalibacillus filiformis]|uniref:DUF3221 domain-containing protein n=1 Tax=Alkalibacillus filiformis TaxID=200990 RepID=A0ABU0DPQ9_9BACI|nr:hypothetical protein [Alkalibacillus filiformis]MDQ0350319.1 hypothetical protein [Alkalibacillus filiformis]
MKFIVVVCWLFLITLAACTTEDTNIDIDQSAENTLIEVADNNLIHEDDGYYEVNTLEELLDSELIVKGEVVEIEGPFETEDLINELFQDYNDYFKFHIDLIIEVDEYYGNTLPYDEIVVRREGGKIDDRAHITPFEHFAIGEKVLIFN